MLFNIFVIYSGNSSNEYLLARLRRIKAGMSIRCGIFVPSILYWFPMHMVTTKTSLTPALFRALAQASAVLPVV